MAYVSKKDLIDKLNPLHAQLLDQKEELEGLLEEMNQDSLEELVDQMDQTLQEIKTAIDESKD